MIIRFNINVNDFVVTINGNIINEDSITINDNVEPSSNIKSFGEFLGNLHFQSSWKDSVVFKMDEEKNIDDLKCELKDGIVNGIKKTLTVSSFNFNLLSNMIVGDENNDNELTSELEIMVEEFHKVNPLKDIEKAVNMYKDILTKILENLSK